MGILELWLKVSPKGPKEISSKIFPPLVHSSPSEVKERHGDFPQQLRSFPLFIGVWRAAGVLVQHPKQVEAQDGLQRENCHCYREVDPERDKTRFRRREKQGDERGGGDSQFVPFDVVEEAPVCAHSLGLDRFEQVLAVVGEGTHEEVLLIAATQQHDERHIFTCTQLKG